MLKYLSDKEVVAPMGLEPSKLKKTCWMKLIGTKLSTMKVQELDGELH